MEYAVRGVGKLKVNGLQPELPPMANVGTEIESSDPLVQRQNPLLTGLRRAFRRIPGNGRDVGTGDGKKRGEGHRAAVAYHDFRGDASGVVFTHCGNGHGLHG